MEGYLYNNLSNNSYYIITNKGTQWNVCIDILTFTSKFINNDDLNKFEKIKLNKNSIIDILNKLNLYSSNISLDYFDEYNYLYYKMSLIKIYNWNDMLNFISTIL